MRKVTSTERSWDPERLIHRQTYIDLIRAYLSDYGSQRDLARALGLSEAYVSYLLQPLSLAGSREPAHWSVLLSAAGYEITDALKFAKTPSRTRARQIAEQLVTDADRRHALLYHVSMARTPTRPRAAGPPPLSASEASTALRMVGVIHQDALYNPAEPVTAASYVRVWRHARDLPASIDPCLNPVDHAQALMFLHDTAQALGRADLALGFARRVLSVLPAGERGSLIAYSTRRLRINALLAEVVSLNSLGLRAEAWRAGSHAESLTGFRDEPETWLRSFIEQRLAAMTGFPRASVYHAENMADQALSLVADNRVLQAGITRRLLDVYLARPTGRSVRKAARLSDELSGAIIPETGMSPLRRAQILRILARYHTLAGDREAAAHLVRQCLYVTAQANLVHQREALVREFSAPRPPGT